MRPYDAIIFDFDGTLAELTIDFDLMRRKVRALAMAFLPACPETNGQPVLEMVEALAAIIGKDDPDLGREFHTRCRLTIVAQELDAARDGRLFDFTRPMLSELRARGVATGIITRNCTAAVRSVYPEVEKECDVFIGREDAVRVKPDPIHLTAALDRLGVAPGRALMVGDHPMDVVTATRAGAHGAGVLSGHTAKEELLKAKPRHVAADCMELLRNIAAL